MKTIFGSMFTFKYIWIIYTIIYPNVCCAHAAQEKRRAALTYLRRRKMLNLHFRCKITFVIALRLPSFLPATSSSAFPARFCFHCCIAEQYRYNAIVKKILKWIHCLFYNLGSKCFAHCILFVGKEFFRIKSITFIAIKKNILNGFIKMFFFFC